MIEPRAVAPGAWKRWLKESVRLGGRVWMSLLAFSLVVGLTGGWFAHQALFAGFIVCVVFFGLWQAMLMSAAEKAASGKRVTVGDAIDGVMGFWKLPGRQAQFQITFRLVCCVICYAFFFLVFVLPLLWYLSNNPQEAAELAKNRSTQALTGVWAQLFYISSGWGLVFFWSWINQRGSILSCTNMLVRRYEMAVALWERAVRLNRANIRPLYFFFFAMLLAMFLMPVLVFPLEVFWVCVVTVAGRDIFEQQEKLAPQEARVTSAGLASA